MGNIHIDGERVSSLGRIRSMSCLLAGHDIVPIMEFRSEVHTSKNDAYVADSIHLQRQVESMGWEEGEQELSRAESVLDIAHHSHRKTRHNRLNPLHNGRFQHLGLAFQFKGHGQGRNIGGGDRGFEIHWVACRG